MIFRTCLHAKLLLEDVLVGLQLVPSSGLGASVACVVLECNLLHAALSIAFFFHHHIELFSTSVRSASFLLYQLAHQHGTVSLP